MLMQEVPAVPPAAVVLLTPFFSAVLFIIALLPFNLNLNLPAATASSCF
jgi:hypothetical protein